MPATAIAPPLLAPAQPPPAVQAPPCPDSSLPPGIILRQNLSLIISLFVEANTIQNSARIFLCSQVGIYQSLFVVYCLAAVGGIFIVLR